MPLRFLKSKLNILAVSGPEVVIVTDGVPYASSIVAVGIPKLAAAPASPGSPFGPFKLFN